MLARITLAGVWVYAAATKIGDPDAAVRAVRAYDVVPEVLVDPLAWGLPAIELVLAALLVVGIATRPAAWTSVVILGVFIVGIASAWSRGLQIECGCFGGGGPADVDGFDYALDIARDLAFIALALVVALGPEDRLRLGSRLPASRRPGLRATAILVVSVACAAALGIAIQDRRSGVESGRIEVPVARAGEPSVHGTPWTEGKRDAPVVVEVFENFTCSTCRRLHDGVEPALLDLAREGTVRIAYHPMATTGREAVLSAAAAACAYDAGAFPEYRDALFAAQGDQPVPSTSSTSTARGLIALGRTVGITDPGFAECVRTERYAAWVRRQTDAASRRGVIITPTVLVDGQLVDHPLRPDELVEAIRAAARGA